MWYQFARLIMVQIALLLGCFCSIAVATIGYVAAMLLVKIEGRKWAAESSFKNICEDVFVHAEEAAATSRKKEIVPD
jgi:hypothetical protein